jgi:isocitrate/isopropylmalate dehydrogenase
MREYRLAAIAGDGIGREVIPAGLKVLAAVTILRQSRRLSFCEPLKAACRGR